MWVLYRPTSDFDFLHGTFAGASSKGTPVAGCIALRKINNTVDFANIPHGFMPATQLPADLKEVLKANAQCLAVKRPSTD